MAYLNRTRWMIIGVMLGSIFLLWSFGRNAPLNALDTDAQGRPIGTAVARIYYDEVADLTALAELGLDLHEYNNLQEKYVLASVDADLFDLLVSAEWAVTLDAEATQALNVQRLASGNASSTYYGGYRTVAEMEAILNNTVAAHPTITELFDYGDSYCKQNGPCNVDGISLAGHDLLAIRVGNEANPAAPMQFGSRPVLFMMAAIHSRELTTSEQALFYLDYLVSNYGVDPDITWLIDWHDIYIIPMANPDGRFVVENILTPGSQRKNARQDSTTCNAPSSTGWSRASGQPGIDLNRNHSHGYDTGGSSAYNCSLVYRGTAAASEPEVAELEAFVRTLIPDQRGTGLNDAAPDDAMGVFLTIHAYSDLILWPWGNVTTQAPNHTDLKAISDKLGVLTGYTSCQPSICLYITSGTSDDWAYGELGVPSFTYEVGSSTDGFFPSYTMASVTHWDEVRESLIYSARIARTPYQLAHGPDVTAVTIVPFIENQFVISAELSDATNGNQTIVSAELFVGSPPWTAGATSVALAPKDGAFDSVSDSAETTINVCQHGLTNGKHLVWVRGVDSGGQTGPVWAQWIIVTDALNCDTIPTAITGTAMTATSPASYPLYTLMAFALLTSLTTRIFAKHSTENS